MFEGDRGERALPGGGRVPLKGGSPPGAQHPQPPREKPSFPIRYTILLMGRLDEARSDQGWRRVVLVDMTMGLVASYALLVLMSGSCDGSM